MDDNETKVVFADPEKMFGAFMNNRYDDVVVAVDLVF